jgi:dUTP pyrophosphatase
MEVNVVLAEGAIAPAYQTKGAAGFDLHSTEEAKIRPGDRAIIGTGLFFEISEGWELQIRSRSGLAAKNGIKVLNAPGTIDSDYRGEVKIILFNSGRDEFVVNKGDRIAQGVFGEAKQLKLRFVQKISETERGTSGFGSTGVK